ncbi:MAG: hydrogenase maturation protease [Candidatus Bipolaricaulota bacterium]|nr:hydrogenase maturation protease [Candidatus Bipolaricaulota bacterium]
MDLILGIGNELRGDDGVGARVVELLPPRAGVETGVVHQLTPELADRLCRAGRVLFVDAHVADDAVRLSPLKPVARAGVLGHALTPEALLEWTRMVHGRAPEGWLLTVPARSFALGESLSAEAESAVPEACETALSWLEHPASHGVLEEDV